MIYLLAAILALVLMYKGKGYYAWAAPIALLMVNWHMGATTAPSLMCQAMICAFIVAVVVFGVHPLRAQLISRPIMGIVKKILPTIGETERIALEAGDAWWEADLFQGNPDWNKLHDLKIKPLTKKEQAFLDNETEELCKLLDDEKIAQDRDLSPKAWEYIKKKKFLGMIIPEEHGGLGFGAAGHAAVVTKISSKSLAAAVTVMVPNSLGPGELLMHYGTDEQKKRYLKPLAEGKDIPCFALTEPLAGSDAASGTSEGVVVKKKINGKEMLGISLTLNKRYITLAPIATVVGLAFKLKDPKNYLGKGENIGITCALIDRATKGLDIGNQHDPMGVPFRNGPIRAKDMFVPIDTIIGGPDYAGQGWRMLMECLGAGRGISLPSLAVGATQVSTRATTAYANVREQFGIAIGKFEGVREPITQMASNSYWMDATKRMTCGAVDLGVSPSVASAIAKAYLTEAMRKDINAAMDVFGGAAICRGENNIFARHYNGIPIGITVEGANILTRSLIVYGQGAMRCHPYLQAEVNAIGAGNLKAFDAAFFGHVNHVFTNGVRSFFLTLTGGAIKPVPAAVPLEFRKYYRTLNRLTASLAYVADIGLACLGGELKRREYLSGHYADAFAHIFIASSVLKRLHDEGYKSHDAVAAHHALVSNLHTAELALSRVITNLPNKFFGLFKMKARLYGLPFGVLTHEPDDALNDALAAAALGDEKLRETLTSAIHIPHEKEAGLGTLEAAYTLSKQAEAAKKRLLKNVRSGKIAKADIITMAKQAREASLLSVEDENAIKAAHKAMVEVVQVADYAPKVYDSLK